MRRCKLAVYILVILSICNSVPVLAAPIQVQRVREACADVADGDEDVIIVSGKRAEEEQEPWSWYHGMTQASPGSGSKSVQLSTSSPHPPRSLSTADYASWVHQETTNPIQPPSSASGEMRRSPDVSGVLPWYSSDQMRKPSYASGGTDLPWTSPGGGSKIPPATSVRTKTNKWVPTTEVEPAQSSSGEMRRPSYASGGNELPWTSPGGKSKIPQRPPATSVRTKTNKWVPTTEVEPAQSSSGEMRRPSYASGGKELPWTSPGGKSKIPQRPPATSVRTKTNIWVPTAEVPPVSSSRIHPLSEQEGYLAQTPTKQPKPQSESFLSKSKNFFSDLVGKLRFALKP